MSMLSSLNWVDLTLLGILIAGGIFGYMQGLLREVVSLAALYIGAILSAQYYVMVANWIRAFFPHAPVRFANAIGFLAILLFVTIVINWLVYDAYRSTRIKLLPLLDHIGGGFMGLVTAAVAITLLLPVLRFATSEMWPVGESARLILSGGLQISRVGATFNLAVPRLLDTLSPWLPGGLPSIFNL